MESIDIPPSPVSAAVNTAGATSVSAGYLDATKNTPLLQTTDNEDAVVVNTPVAESQPTESQVAVTDQTREISDQQQGTEGNDGTTIPASSSNVSMQNVASAATFVNEQVGKVRQLAEEGPLSFRVLAFLGGVAMIVTSVLDWVGEIFAFKLLRCLISIYTFLFGIVICILEGRTFVPETHKYQQKLVGFAKILQYVWGRGLFYFFAGALQFSQMRILDIASGGFMIFVGIVSLIVGNRTAKKLHKLSESISDEQNLLEKFTQFDLDKDDYLEQNDFAELVAEMGLDLDHNELVAAFSTIDADDDQKISFEDFKTWWTGFSYKSAPEASLLV